MDMSWNSADIALDQVIRSKFGGPRWRLNLKRHFFRWRVYQQKVMQDGDVEMGIRKIMIKQRLEFRDLDERIT